MRSGIISLAFRALVAAGLAAVPFSAAGEAMTSDLSLRGTAPASVDRGSPFSYVFTITNYGPSAATNVSVSAIVPLGLTFGQAGSDESCSVQEQLLTCSVPLIAPDEARSVTVLFSTPFHQICTEVTDHLTASVKANENDPNLRNNDTSDIITQIRCVPFPPQCSDGLDNDEDGLIDLGQDPGCSTASGDNESQDEIDKVLATQAERQRMRVLSRQGILPTSSSSASFSSSSATSSSSSVPTRRQDVQVLVQSLQTEVSPGNRIPYVIMVRNPLSTKIIGASVELTYPAEALSILPGNNGTAVSAGKHRWIVDLEPQQVTVIRLMTVVSPQASQGRLETSIRVTGVPGQVETRHALAVIRDMPKTGASYFGAFEDGLLKPYSGDSSAAAAFWLILSSGGILAGAFVSRRMAAR